MINKTKCQSTGLLVPFLQVSSLVILLVFCLFMPQQLAAQKKKTVEFQVNGTVKDELGTPLQGVLVDLKESLVFALTDLDGAFSIKVPEHAELLFSLKGYRSQSIKISKSETIVVNLIKENEWADPLVDLLYGVKQRESMITSAVSTVRGEELEDNPASFLGLAITGKLPGLTTIQTTGAPGSDNTQLFIRGRRSWMNQHPIAYVDGHLRPYSMIDAHEVDQISIFKDAGAQSVLGLRGTNGALLITTRRGREGRPLLRFNAQLNIEEPIKRMKFVDSWQYATLHNEARRNDGHSELYTSDDLAKYLSGESPYTHPNVDWMGESMKKSTLSQAYNLSVEGGTSVAKYFVNLSFITNDGLYNTDKDINTYNTNAGASRYSIRSNVDIALTKTLDLAVSLYGRQMQHNNPGGGSSSDVFNTLYSIPSNKFPLNYGPDKVAGTNEFRKNPYGILNHSGYSKYLHSTVESSIGATQKLDFLTKGLRAKASLAFDARFSNTINRSKSYLVYEYTGTDPNTGEDQFKTWGDKSKQKNENSFGDQKIRIFDVDAGFDYDRAFGKHHVMGSFMYMLSQESDDTKNLPNYHQGIHSRVTYAYDSRYIGEFSLGYQGTEQLPPEKRYGFFPAGSVGWIASNESFIKENVGDVLSFLKFRASYGLTGNDGGLPYYLYLTRFKLVNKERYFFGTTPLAVAGWQEDNLFLEDVTWEEAAKLNLGVDLRLFKDKLSLGFDYFNEETSQILSDRKSVSTILGLGASKGPKGNVGEATNKGFEATAEYRATTGKVQWNVGGNIAYATNKILFNDGQDFAYSYRKQVNNPIGAHFGYQTNGLYIDEQDRLNSPNTAFGDSYAGDIKYRDINGDGLVNTDDISCIGKGNLSEISYAFYLGAAYKGFDMGMVFAGQANRDYTIEGVGIIAFTNISGTGGPFDGNAQQYHWDHRYNPLDPGTWTTAEYPRLSLAGRSHNSQTSDFWQEKGDFLRLKTVELGYTLPQQLTQRLSMSKVRVFYSGYNLLTWDNMRVKDPEGSADGSNYPIQRISSIGINIQF